jgi:N-acetylglutamate synthase-like GNAT family acetyltransferase
MFDELQMRRAERGDETALLSMQADSIRVLGAPYYSSDALEAFIARVGTMDPTLIDERRYFVVERAGQIIACGGWSTRRPQYAAFAKAGHAKQHADGPVVRSVFVSPCLARLGLGRRLMARIESEIAEAGFRTVALTATLSGAPFYARLGYAAAPQVSLALGDGLEIAGVPMRKDLMQLAA